VSRRFSIDSVPHLVSFRALPANGPAVEQAEVALVYLSAIDPLMFETAMDAADQVAGVAPRDEAAGDDEAVPVCHQCGGQVGIFPDHGLDWQHFRGDWTTSGAQEIYDPGHPAEVTWRLPGEDPEQP
jgi:hypothetical protein